MLLNEALVRGNCPCAGIGLVGELSEHAVKTICAHSKAFTAVVGLRYACPVLVSGGSVKPRFPAPIASAVRV